MRSGAVGQLLVDVHRLDEGLDVHGGPVDVVKVGPLGRRQLRMEATGLPLGRVAAAQV